MRHLQGSGGDKDEHLDIGFFPNSLHGIDITSRQLCGTDIPVAVSLAGTCGGLGLRGGHGVEKNASLVQEVEALDNVPIGDIVGIGHLILVVLVLAHRTGQSEDVGRSTLTSILLDLH